MVDHICSEALTPPREPNWSIVAASKRQPEDITSKHSRLQTRDCISSCLNEGKNVTSRHDEQTRTARSKLCPSEVDGKCRKVWERDCSMSKKDHSSKPLGEVREHAVASSEQQSIH